jgi:hypothetical protein
MDANILEAGLDGHVLPFGYPAAARVLDNLKSRLRTNNGVS